MTLSQKTLLSDNKKPSKSRGDSVDPAVKYVREQRKKRNEDEKDAKVESEALKVSKEIFSEFYNMNTYTKQVASELWAERIAKKMTTWAMENEDALILNEFYQSVGILSQDFCDLAKKYPILQKALDYTRMVIGTRREKGMITRKYDAGSIAYMMPHYNSAWRENVSWRASLKQPEGNSGTVRMQYVVIPEIRSVENGEISQRQLVDHKDSRVEDSHDVGEDVEGSERV
jgi:hypothetical protein